MSKDWGRPSPTHTPAACSTIQLFGVCVCVCVCLQPYTPEITTQPVQMTPTTSTNRDQSKLNPKLIGYMRPLYLVHAVSWPVVF